MITLHPAAKRNETLSTITLGTLQDIGYNVKYSKADPSYMPFCQTEYGPSISANEMPPAKPTLSELKREKAIQYGQAILEQTAKEAPQPRIRGGDQRITYSADLFVNGKSFLQIYFVFSCLIDRSIGRSVYTYAC